MKYRKKPVVIEAIKWDNEMKTYEEIKRLNNGDSMPFSVFHPDESIMIKTLEGWHKGNKGDYIIKGVKGEFYPCKPDIFKMTYEKVK